MGIITIISDWSKSDYYIGAVKGRILSKNPSTVIVDINHQVAPFNNMHAAFILRNCYHEFPPGTIHLIGVNSALSAKRSLLIIEKNKHYILCSDSGFPDLLFPNEDKKIYQRNIEGTEGNTFISLNIFVDIAFKLLNNENPGDLAQLTENYIQQKPFLPTIESNLINGSIVYIDSYSNVITNINRETFERVGKGKPFEIYIQSNHYKIQLISKTYNDIPTGELVAIFNSMGLLEIAIVNGPIAELLDLSINSVVRVKFLKGKKTNELQLIGE
jgi:S-adenosylmethionine hydrolase